MIANMNEKGRQTKLLAAVAVFAMVVCALAVVMPSSDVNAANGDSATNVPEPVNGTVTLTENLTLDGRYYVPENVTTIDLGGFTLTADTDDNFAIEVPAGVSVTINNGTISSSTGGINVKGTVTLGSDLVVNSGTIKALQIVGGNATINGAELTTTSAVDSTIYIANSDSDNTSNSVSGKLTVNSGTITGGGYAISGNNLQSAGSLIDINGGTISVEDTSIVSAIFIPMESTVTIDNATIIGGVYVKMGNVTINNTTINETRTYSADTVPSGDGGETNGSAVIIGAQKYGSAEGQYLKSADLSVTIGSNVTISSTNGNDVDVFNCNANTTDVQSVNVDINAALEKARVINDDDGTQSRDMSVELNDVSELTLTGDADVTVNGDVTLATGATVTKSLVVNEGSTVTGDIQNNGVVRVLGTVDGDITNDTDAVMTLGTNANVTGEVTGDGKVMSDSAYNDDNTGLQGQLNFNLELSTSEYLAGNYVIAEGYTMTLHNGGSLSLNGYSLIIYGTLIIENGGSITGIGGAGEGILLTSSGTITNSGVIGKGTTAVKVYANTDGSGNLENATEAGSVTIQNVTGISFGLDRTVSTANGDRTVVYDLTFNGNAVRNGTGDYRISADGAIVNGDLTIGNSIVFTAENDGVTVSDSSTVEVNGTIGGSVVLENGAIINLNGTTNNNVGVKISAKTGIYQSNQSTNISTLLGTTEVTVINVTGVSFEVTSTSYMVEEVSMTEQRLVMSGSASQTTVPETVSSPAYSVTISGTAATGVVPDANKYIGVFVTGEFYYPQDTRAVTLGFQNSAKITVTGQLSSDNQIITTTNASSFIGTAYSTGTGSSEMFYVTGFEQAYGQIANANSQTITVYGALDISTEVVIASGQTLDISNAAGVVDITSTGDVEISNGGNVVGTINDVDGVLTVIYGGVCNQPTTYDVRTTNDNNDVTYSGLAYALDNATEGQTINLVGNATVTSLTVPTGIILDVNEGASLAVERNLTVNGTLNNHGTVDVGRDVTVSGTMDTTEGTFTANGTGYTITVTGVLTMPAGTTVTSAKYNGTSYTNDEGYVVVTSLASAIADIADYDIKPTLTMYGRVSETGGFDVSSNVSIASGAQVTIDSLTLSGCQLSVASDATFTGSVSGQSGEDGSTVTSTVDLNRVSDLTVANSSARNAANVTVWTTSVATTAVDETLDGKVTVSAGTVTLGSDMTVNDDSNQEPSMTVSSGATFVIPGDYTLTSNDGVSFEGTVTVNGTFTADGAAVSGTMDIADGGVVNVIDMTVTGTVNVSATEGETGTLNVGVANPATEGVLTIGEQPETLGQTTTGSISGKVTFVNGYVRAYSGADMSAATYDEGDGVSTAYSINDVLYMTVYAAQNGGFGIAYVGSNTTETYDIAGYDVPSPLEWHAGDRTVGTEAIGYYDAVSATFTASYAKGTISVGTGLTMYIDGLTVSNFQQTINGVYGYYLTVGEHTVTIAADANYNADQATITFNGQTVQNGGTITVTPEMVQDGFVLSATGATASTPGSGEITVNVPSQDDGMSLTDILLIVLVVLILVMAIIVALRLMRS